MPDISMCPSVDCPSRSNCYRHTDSGTKPNEYRQTYTVFEWNLDAGKCDDYWPNPNKENT